MTRSRGSDLRRVERAAAKKSAAGVEYLAALAAARDAGRTLAEIAAAAGVSRQAVHKSLTAASQRPR